MKKNNTLFRPSLWAVLLLSTLFQFFGQLQAVAGPPQPSMVLQYHIDSLHDAAYVPLPGINNCTIHWGDGSDTSATSSALYQHVYADTGLYTVTIYGTATHFGLGAVFNNEDSMLNNLIRVTNWANLGLTSLEGAFAGASNLIEVPNYLPSTVTNLSFAFYRAGNFNDPNISTWNVTNVDSMFATFYFATSFNQPLNSWNVSNVKTLFIAFAFAVTFNQPLNNWNVSKVDNMYGLFAFCYQFNQPLNNWDVSNVISMDLMFVYDTSFNQNLSMWCVEKISTKPSDFDVVATQWTDSTLYPKWGQACIPLTCAQPTALTATPTSNSVTLSFTKAASAQNTQVQFRLKNTGVWGGTSVAGTSHTFTGLSANTTYEYRLRSLCSNSLNSSFTTVGEFTTTAATPLPVCQAPTNISHLVTGNTGVTFNWTAANNGALYFVQMKPSTSTWAQAGGASTASNSRTFNNLQAGTWYDYRIRTTCTAATTLNAMSVFSAVGQFLTDGGPALANFNTANTTWSVYPNPTNDVVNIEFVASEEAPMTIEVLDIAGRKVQEIATQSLMGNNQIQISLSNVNSGLYFIKATQNHEVKALLKVTKQ
ncbi:MAG: BspA family leucine-rich repeat surface protein [Chitinophagaceae bacterium]